MTRTFKGLVCSNVTAGPTSGTTVSGSPNPSIWGASVTFTATVTGTNGVPPLTGTVTFKDGATILGTGTLSGSPTATATFSTNGLAIGSHTITAIYSGDSNFAGSTSGNFTQTVNPGPFAKLQLLLPGEAAAPGTSSGKTGTPNDANRRRQLHCDGQRRGRQLEPGQHQRHDRDLLQRRQRRPCRPMRRWRRHQDLQP